MKKYKIILFLFSFFSIISYSQDCNYYSAMANCRIIMHRDYKIYLKSQYTTIGINDTLTYNIVFNGQRDYVITLCADQEFYSINIKLLQPETRKVLYDNAKDDYFESLGIGFNNTQNMILKVTLLAKKNGKVKINRKEKACVSLSMQWKSFSKGNNNI